MSGWDLRLNQSGQGATLVKGCPSGWQSVIERSEEDDYGGK